MTPPMRSCPVCSQVLAAPGPCPNRWCRRPDRPFSVVYTAGSHQGGLREAIVRYKYRADRSLAQPLAGFVAAFVAGHPTWFEEFDLIGSVPSYTGRGARRGWDPAGEILARAGQRLGPDWPVDPGLLSKRAETPAMAGRSWSQRQAISRGPLRRALRLGPGRSVAGARVLVFDDVLTEGSTLAEVARLLVREGAEEVAGLVLARPPRAGPLGSLP